MQNAPKVILYDGTTEEGFHDIDNVGRVNEVFINVNSITEMLSSMLAEYGETLVYMVFH